MVPYNQRRQGGHRAHSPMPSLDIGKIRLEKIGADLFDSVARETAKTLAANTKSNKPTQLRKFYDEIVMWENRVMMHPDKFQDYLPFIRMLNAKVAYAHGRNNKKDEPDKGLVDMNYLTLISHCLKQVNDDKTMRNFKLFMEAMMGFYKQERPKD